MKLLDDQGKIFGCINPLDLAVIIVIGLIGAKVIWDFRPVSLQTKEYPVTIGLLVRDVPPYVAESLVVGQDLFDDAFDAYLGKIQAIRTGPAELLLPLNGRVILSRSPRNQDIRLEITKQKGRIEKGTARSGIYLGKIVARVGTRLQAHTRYTAILGEIMYVKVNKR
jgi:hypothetical protein